MVLEDLGVIDMLELKFSLLKTRSVVRRCSLVRLSITQASQVKVSFSSDLRLYFFTM